VYQALTLEPTYQPPLEGLAVGWAQGRQGLCYAVFDLSANEGTSP
jgi:hypothetical protein